MPATIPASAAPGLGLPAAIVGTWCPEPTGAPCWHAADTMLAIDGRTCAIVGQRTVTPRRWYLDARCADGHFLEIDVVALDGERVMVARRPLGQAVIFKRAAATTDIRKRETP